MDKTKDGKIAKLGNIIQTVIEVSVALCFVILMLFVFFPEKNWFPLHARIPMFLVVDFSIGLFFVELIMRFFLWQKSMEKETTAKGNVASTTFDNLKCRCEKWMYRHNIDYTTITDVIALGMVIIGFFSDNIEFYGVRIISVILLMFVKCGKTDFIDFPLFVDYFKKDSKDDDDKDQSDDRNKFLRYLVYFNLACFVFLTFESIRHTNNIVGVWFVITFVASFSALFYIADIILRFNELRKIDQQGNKSSFWSTLKNFLTDDKWNLIDTLLTTVALMSIVDILANMIGALLKSDDIQNIVKESIFLTEKGSSYSRFAMIIRPFAQLRIFRTEKKLKEITRIIAASFRGILWALFYFVVLFVIYGAVGHMILRHTEGGHFSTFANAIQSLFRIMTFESWGVLMEDTMRGQQVPDMIVISYYYSFIIFVSYIMWSVIQGLIVSRIQEKEQEIEKEHKTEQKQLSDADLAKKLDAFSEDVKKLTMQIEDIKGFLKEREKKCEE